MFLQFGSLTEPGTSISEDRRRQLGLGLKHLSTEPRIRWAWLFVLLPAAVLWPALTRNIAALAYDAAMEHVPRGVVFSQAISDGVLYPRWTQFLHWGLGSPLFTFQPPLPYYGLDLLYRMGLPHPVGWRILMAIGLVAAFFGAYLLVRTVTGQRWPAVVAGVAYLYAPYVLRNSLERGSNEAFSMFLYPWVLWGLIWVARPRQERGTSRPSMGRFVIATLLWAACIASHVLAPLILLPFAALLAAYLVWRRRSWTPLGVLVAGGLLTAAVWMPMIPEQSFVQVERDFTYPGAIPADNSIPLDALLAPPVIYDITRDNNGSGNRVGALAAAILIAGIPGAAIACTRRRRTLALALGASTLAGLLLFWMLTGASDLLWTLPGVGAILARLLYRTRLMGLLSLAVACTAGLLVALLSVRRQRAAGLLLTVLLILVALPALYLELQHRYGSFGTRMSLVDVRATEIATGGKALTAFGEFTPRWREAPFDEGLVHELGPDYDPQRKPLRSPPQEIEVRAARVGSSAWDLEVVAPQPATATFYLLYYPRWSAWLDGQPAALRPEPDSGYAQLDLPGGSHRITLRYGTTTAETAGLLVSGLTLLALLGATGWTLLRRAGAVPVRRAAVNSPTTAPNSRDPKRDDRARSSGAKSCAVGGIGGEAPPFWLLLGVTALLVVKFAYVDSMTTWFRCVSTPDRVCGADATVAIPFPDAPSLRGYAVPTYKVKPGGELRVSLFWQGERGAARRLSSFVHVRNSQRDQSLNPRTGSDIWAQEDRDTPGGLPAEDYVAGKLYRDDFRVTLPGDMPQGNYLLEVGLADPSTGEQLDPQANAVQPPLKVLWRSILLPSVEIR